MESKFKTTIFWIFFALFLFFLFAAIFDFLSKSIDSGELFLSFAFMFAGILFLMKKRTGKGILFFILAIIFLALGLYVSSTIPRSLNENERAVALQYAEPIVNNLLAGLNEKNHSKFLKDFAPEITMDLENFEKLIKLKGKYISKSEPAVSRIARAVTLSYNIKFEKDNSGVLEITIRDINGKKFITNLSIGKTPGAAQQ